MAESRELQDGGTEDYLVRYHNRLATIGRATMALVTHFITGGDDLDTSRGKVKQLSQEISGAKPGAKTDYMLGDTQDLIDRVNASALSFMDTTAKSVVTDILDP